MSQRDLSTRHPRTTLTGVLILLVTIPFVLSAASLWRVAFGTIDTDTTLRLVAYDWDPENAGIFLQLAALVMAATCVWTAVLGVGVLLRMETMRMAGLLTFAAFGLVTLMLALGSVSSNDRPAGWVLAAAVAVVNVAIALLLWDRQVADDIARGAHERRSRRRPRQDA